MGIFNMLEMLFFVSLAISFVLIVFVVYHFRQKIIALEDKCDTMFELINNIVKEMNNRNNLIIQQQIPNNIMLEQEIPLFVEDTNLTKLDKLVVSESESEGESQDESDDEESDDEESESEDNTNYILPEEIDNNDKSVKIISVDMNDIDENVNTVEENIISNECSDIEDPDIQDGLDDNTEQLYIKKLDETTLENKIENVESIDMDVYRKMNLTALKALVIEKGYASDTAKMKKAELLHLLEASGEM